LPAQYEGRYCMQCGSVFAITPGLSGAGNNAKAAACSARPLSRRRKANVSSVFACLLIVAALVWFFATAFHVLLK